MKKNMSRNVWIQPGYLPKVKFIKQFEDNFSKFTGIKNSVAVSNGTVAIHVALLALWELEKTTK